MEDYDQLAKSYKLPSYDELDKEFDFYLIEDYSFPLREVRKKMSDKLENLKDIFSQVLQPNPESIVDMHETKFFKEDERNEIFVLYTELQKLLRMETICSLKADEKSDAEWIKTVHHAWKGIKKRSLPFIEKMKDSWEKLTPEKAELRYLG